MIITSLAIAGGAGGLGYSVKVYRDKKRLLASGSAEKREYPWTVAAERMAKRKDLFLGGKRRSRFGTQAGMIEHVSEKVKQMRLRTIAMTQEMIAPLVSDSRQQQLEEIMVGSDFEISSAEKKARQNVRTGSLMVALAVGGALFHPALYVPCGLLMVHDYVSFYLPSAYKALIKEHRLDINVLHAFFVTGSIAGGFFFATAIGFWYVSLMQLLLAKTEDHSKKSLINLFGEQPRFVWVLVDGVEVEIPFENLQIGDLLLVVAGQSIPVDGTITTGEALIDQHMLTGESQPVEAGVGDSVFASTMLLSGHITIQVEKAGADTVAASIGQILSHTADFKLSVRSRVDAFQSTLTPAMLTLSAGSLPWLGLNGALGVLWNYPGFRALVLAPMSTLNYLHLCSQRGILIKDGRSLELLRDIDTIVFDKTGTLTEEIPTVSQVISCDSFSKEALLTYAATAEYKQTHPIAKAILAEAEKQELVLPNIDDTHVELGYGVKVTLGEQVIRIGSERFMDISGIAIPDTIKAHQARCHTEGHSLVMVAIDDQLGGAIELMPTIRAEAREVVRALHDMGKELIIISGDHEAPTRQMAEALGIKQYFANTLPENKANLVEQLQQQGRKVCFVGDGINDAIALKKANVSISLRGATTAATDTAQIVLMDESLEQLPYLLQIANEFKHHIDETFIITIVPNLLGIAGAFFLHWSLLTNIAFSLFFWLPQLAHTMLPLVKHKENASRSSVRKEQKPPKTLTE